MELNGKKVNFLGDSITQGIGVSAPDKKYVEVFARKYGVALARNYGISGTRIARQINPTDANPSFDKNYCDRVCEMDPDADIVVVFGGTNDFGHGDAPFGCFSDRTPETFYGACHTLCTSIIERFPEAEIVIMTPLHRAIEDRENRPSLCEFVKAIREVAEFYSIPVLDLYKNAGIQPMLEVNKTKYAPDGLHPNDAGAERIADRLGAFLKTL